MIEKTDGASIGVAVVGHAALLAAIVLYYQWMKPEEKEEPPPMEVSFVEEVGPASTAPDVAAEPAPTFSDEVAPIDEAAGADAPIPEPVQQPVREPVAEPVRPPVEVTPRQRPDSTRSPVVVRSSPPPRLTDNRPRQPVRPPQRPGRPATQPRDSGPSSDAITRALRGGAPRQGPVSPAAAAPAQLSGAQRQQISRNISNLIAPCVGRAQAPNDLARSISVALRVTVTREGVPTAHTVVSSSGVNASNSDYVDDVAAVVVRAIRSCASRIATLPDDQYAVAGGWRTFNYRFRFP